MWRALKTYPYRYIPEYPIKVGSLYYFGQLWQGKINEEYGIETLLSGKIETEENTIYFTHEEIKDNYCETIVKVIEIK